MRICDWGVFSRWLRSGLLAVQSLATSGGFLPLSFAPLCGSYSSTRTCAHVRAFTHARALSFGAMPLRHGQHNLPADDARSAAGRADPVPCRREGASTSLFSAPPTNLGEAASL
jgi:hypothetical protein